ncbi:Aste57867_14636 [Aphanomyces stellatus]|uniref:Aste57867_14636 protein n=1 Tax=Aphanomyces stellatus TaxID=120398 RepID=A0A485L252_9STRA|nr:hypothetical protein As57867_014581 [Aphanomyces stellatus]VFT91455.1 Aste57867_14636 [Aphanomyces stellatus]
MPVRPPLTGPPVASPIADRHDSSEEEAKKLARRLKRRGYIRKMMQHYRQKERQDFATLHRQALGLEEQLRYLQAKASSSVRNASQTHLLPWKEVALALLGERMLSMREKETLVGQVDQVAAIVRDMSQWVAAHHVPLPMLPRHISTSWRNNTLLASDASRALGKDWILEQMHRNADRVFQQHGFPSLDSQQTFEHVACQVDDAGFVYVMAYQMVTVDTPPIDHVLCGFRNQLCHILGVNGKHEIRQATTVVESTATTSLHQMATHSDESVNLLCGQFNISDAHGMLVAQQILDDERWPHTCPQRHRMLWFERMHLPCGRKNIVRMLYIVNQSCDANGSMWHLDREAHHFNVDFTGCHTDHAKEAHFRRAHIEFGELAFAQARARLQQAPPTAPQ